jgi:hypothetical protein
MNNRTRQQFAAFVRALIHRTHGQDLIEYGILLGIASAVVILTLNQIGSKVADTYGGAVDGVVAAGAGGVPGGGGGTGGGGTGGGGNGNGNGNGGGGTGGGGTGGGGTGGGGNGNGNGGSGGGGNGKTK